MPRAQIETRTANQLCGLCQRHWCPVAKALSASVSRRRVVFGFWKARVGLDGGGRRGGSASLDFHHIVSDTMFPDSSSRRNRASASSGCSHIAHCSNVTRVLKLAAATEPCAWRTLPLRNASSSCCTIPASPFCPSRPFSSPLSLSPVRACCAGAGAGAAACGDRLTCRREREQIAARARFAPGSAWQRHWKLEPVSPKFPGTGSCFVRGKRRHVLAQLHSPWCPVQPAFCALPRRAARPAP